MPEMLQNSEGSRSLPEKSAGTAFPRVPAPLHHWSKERNVAGCGRNRVIFA